MKTSIPTLLAATVIATVTAATAAESSVRYINYGRAGQAAIPQRYTPRMVQPASGTTIALTMEKPGRPVTSVQTMGRAGYHLASRPTYRR